MSKIGLNSLGVGNYDEPRLLAWLDRARPPVVVVMDNSDLALRLQARYPDTLVIFRRWPDDSIPAVSPDPVAWVRLMASYVPDSRIALYAGNEPGPECRATTLTAWTLAALDEADRLGRRLVVGNFGMGGPEDDELRGELRPLLQRIGGTWHVYGYHGYADFHNYRAPGYDPLAGDTWLVGRYRRMFAACDALNIPRPLVAITEHGYDSLTDVYHGWRAGRGVSEADYAAALMDMDGQVYTEPEVLGQCVFCWDETGGNWKTFNVKDAPVLLEALAAYAEDSREIENMPDTERMTVTINTQVKRRREPAGAEVPGTLQPGEYVMDVSEAYTAPLNGDWYVWRFLADPASNVGYYSATGTPADPDLWITVEPLPVEPPQEPPTPPEEPPAVEPPTYEDRLLPIMRAWYASLLEWEQTCADLRGMLVETWPELEG